jgi:Protein of unknown function (DUF3995)
VWVSDTANVAPVRTLALTASAHLALRRAGIVCYLPPGKDAGNTVTLAARNPAAVAAAVLAFASAAVTAFWLLGGTLGLDTVGGQIEKEARQGTAGIRAVLAVTLVAKLAAGGLALALAGSRRARKRWVIVLGYLGGVGLALYGGVLVIAGAVALAVGDSSGRDEYALRWHVFFWDLWFFVWGVAWLLAARRARAALKPWRPASPRPRRASRSRL